MRARPGAAVPSMIVPAAILTLGYRPLEVALVGGMISIFCNSDPGNINQFLRIEINMTDSNFALDGRQSSSRGFGMANVSDRNSSSLHIVLERVDPSRNIARYYVLSIEPTLFATHTIIRRWGRIGSFRRERLQFFGGDDTSQAQVTLETWLARKRKLGYAQRSEPARPALLFRKRVSG